MANLSGQERARYVQDMFGRVAHKYNRMNRIMTFGQDQRWRRFVVQQAQVPPEGTVLDLATGTGDIAFEVLQTTPSAHSVGADFSLPMMYVGQETPIYGDVVDWCGADALHLPFGDELFDAVMSGYLMRNVIDIPRTLQEHQRVLKPGGRIVVLETSPPPNNILKPFISIHLKYIIPILGRLIAGDAAKDAYQYLPESTQAFQTPPEFVALLQEEGYTDIQYRTFMFGTIAVYWATKPPKS